METPLSIMGNFLAKEAQEKVRDKDGSQNLRDKKRSWWKAIRMVQTLGPALVCTTESYVSFYIAVRIPDISFPFNNIARRLKSG